MGFFSWKSAISGKSIAISYGILPLKYSDCYLVTPKKTYHERNYSGYGVFDGVDIYEILGREIVGIEKSEAMKLEELREIGIFKPATFDIKIVLAEEYKGQTYDELPKSEDCPYQGAFFDEEYIRWLGLKDYFCNECNRLTDECECNLDYCAECGEHEDCCSCYSDQ